MRKKKQRNSRNQAPKSRKSNLAKASPATNYVEDRLEKGYSRSLLLIKTARVLIMGSLTVFTILTGTLWYVYTLESKVQKTFNQLSRVIVQHYGNAEILYTDCKNQQPHHIIFVDTKKLRKSLLATVNTGEKMGKLIPPRVFCPIRYFSKWTDLIWHKRNPCSFVLEKGDFFDEEKKSLMLNIAATAKEETKISSLILHWYENKTDMRYNKATCTKSPLTLFYASSQKVVPLDSQ